MEKELQGHRSEDGMVRTGFKKLDRLIGIENLNRNNMICFVSDLEELWAMAFCLALNAARLSRKVIYYSSIGHPREQIITLLESWLSGISVSQLENKNSKLLTAKSFLERLPIIIDDDYNATIKSIDEKISTIENIGAVIVDNVSLLSCSVPEEISGGDRLVYTLESLATLSKKYSIPVLAPFSYSLRWGDFTRAIERFGIMTSEVDTILGLDGVATVHSSYGCAELESGKAEIIILKNRFGKCGSIPILFDKERLKFEEYPD